MRLASVVALVSALGLCSGLARADTPPPSPPPFGGSTLFPAPAVQQLTDASLKAMLENLGYEPKTLNNKDDSVYYEIKAGPWVVQVSLSSSQKNLWFVAWLKKIPTGEQVPSERLLALLSENWKNDPAHFCYVEDSRFLTLTQRMENRDVTPHVFRSALDGFINTMTKTNSEWDVTHWQSPKAAPVSVPK
jgi:hypothetical protein